jgi:5-methylcytosine-specific restriction endonuclease McrA
MNETNYCLGECHESDSQKSKMSVNHSGCEATLQRSISNEAQKLDGSNNKNLSDQLLTDRLLNLTVSERRTTLELLLSLAEFDNRKLFAVTHSSLFSYATQHLKMSEGEVQRRIDGARLLRSFPEFIKDYETGELNLTHATLLRRHFRLEARIQKKKLSRDNQCELIQKLLGKATREAERILVEVSSRPELQKPTSQYEKLLKNGNYRVQFEARPELIAKSERLKEVWSHAVPGATWPELIERAFDLAIEKSDPYAKAERNHLRQQQRKYQQQTRQIERTRLCEEQEHKQKLKAIQRGQIEKQKIGAKAKRRSCQNSISEPHIASNSGADINDDVDPTTGEIQMRLPFPPNETQPDGRSPLARTVSTVATLNLTSNADKCLPTMPLEPKRSSRTVSRCSIKRSRAIPSMLRHAVWLRDHGQCTFIYQNGHCCGNKMGLEIDHVKAFAQGGEHTLNNLRLRCRQHNAYHCVQTFGENWSSF